MNEVRIYALEHYDPTIVAINYAALPHIPGPGGMPFPVRALHGKRKTKQLKFELFKQAINYCYWTATPYKEWEAHGMKEAHAMEAGMLAYIEDPDKDFDKHFPDIPLREERIAALYDLAFNKEAVEAITNSRVQYRMQQFNLAELFPTAFGGDPFRKREILFKLVASDIIGDTTNYRYFYPVAADYQLPRILRHHNALTYCETLAAKVDAQQLIEANSKEEIAIRAATILACDQLATLWNTFPYIVDKVLWCRRNDATAPHHLCKTTAY